VECHRQQLERHLLRVEVEVLHAPQHLVFACRCEDDHIRLRHKLRSPERSEPGLSVHVDVDVQVANGSDAILSTFPGAGEQRVRSHVNVRTAMVFMSEPATVTWRERTFQRNDALLCLCGALVAKQESDRVTRSEATVKKLLSCSIHLDTSNPSCLRARCQGPLAAEEVRLNAGPFGQEEGPMRPLPRWILLRLPPLPSEHDPA